MRSFSSSKLAITVALFFVPLSLRADVVKVVVDDTIHPLIAEHVDRAIQEAQRTHADALLIELRTPGGMMGPMEDIIKKILASQVPVIIYVAPAGTSSSSAGFYILESADVAAMAPGTSTGAAHPVRGDGITMDPVLKEKWENYAASLLRSYVSKRGRNVEVAETAVRQSKSFSAKEALDQNLIEYIADNENDLFRQLEGKTITRFDGSKVVLHLVGKPVHLNDVTIKEWVLSWLMNPNFLVLLMSVGMMAIYTEINHPGAVLPGVVGFIFVLLALSAFRLLPTNYGAVAMLLGAFVLFALEAKVQSHGILTAGGILVMVVGSLLLVDGPIPEMRVNLLTALSIAVPMGLITVFLMNIAIRARRNKVVTGIQGMIGKIGIVNSPLLPAGKVFVHGELWDAIAPANVDAGESVVIRKVEHMTLYVERVPGTTDRRPATA